MRKISFIVISLILLVGVIGLAIAENDKIKPEKITFIHYKDGKIKSIDNNARPTQTTCYKLLGAKWQTTPISYIINPSNPQGLNESFIINAMSASALEWDRYTSRQLFSTYSVDYSANWDDDAPDYRNEYSFSSYSDNRVIAVTIIWGYFSGAPKQRRIIEYDILFNTAFTWGDATQANVMDLQNIATHEIGHGLGLGDLYNTCVQETMYGYSSEGEISKRTLASGDIQGIQKLYGA